MWSQLQPIRPQNKNPTRHDSSARRLRIPARGGVRVQLGAVQDRWRVCGVRPCCVLTSPSRGTGQCCVTAHGPSAWRGAVHHKVQASSVVRADAGRSGVSQPLLRDDLAVRPESFARDPHPSSLDRFCPSGKQTCAGAGKRVVPKRVDPLSAAGSRAASVGAKRQPVVANTRTPLSHEDIQVGQGPKEFLDVL